MLDTLKVSAELIQVILKAEDADPDNLRLAREGLIKLVNDIGAKNFVNIAAKVLKKNFRIEGCNDIRMPLKRIFNFTLEELEENLSEQKYNLPSEHPLSLLSLDHKENLKKLKQLRFSLGALNLNQETSAKEIKDRLNIVDDYYTELDLHIKKEEEVLFPILEQNGMQEHPQNLRDEHRGFKQILSEIIETLKNFSSANPNSVFEEMRKSKEKFISDISNHIFRETFIFYPAALEFITEPSLWEKIKEDFQNLDR